MKKSLLILLYLTSMASFAQTVSYIGNPSTTANGNWGFDGYKYDGKTVDCKSVANANSDLRDEKQSTNGADLIDKKCADAFENGENNPKKCLVTGKVKNTQYGVVFTKITKAEVVSVPVNCQ
jgi:hypothetical protein